HARVLQVFSTYYFLISYRGFNSQGGTNYFSSGKPYLYSDREASSGGSLDGSPRNRYSSGFEYEWDVLFEIFNEDDTCDFKRIDLVIPLMKSSVLQKRSLPSR
ncbi:hypothetical protein M758_UG149900, partial [Ceratodon purpureus]